MDQDGAGQVLPRHASRRATAASTSPSTREHRRAHALRAPRASTRLTLASQDALVEQLGRAPTRTSCSTCASSASGRTTLELDADEVERELAPRSFRSGYATVGAAPLPDGALPPPDTILGAFVARPGGAHRACRGGGRHAMARWTTREALRLGRLLLDDPAARDARLMRITRLRLRDFKRHARSTSSSRPA